MKGEKVKKRVVGLIRGWSWVGGVFMRLGKRDFLWS